MRVLAASERTMTLLFYGVLTGAIVFGVTLPWVWGDRPPTLLETFLFLCLGVLGVLGHYLYTSAYRYAPASSLAPMNYLQLLWAALLGWMTFGHVPDHMSVLGMAVIAASGVAIALNARPREGRKFPNRWRRIR